MITDLLHTVFVGTYLVRLALVLTTTISLFLIWTLIWGGRGGGPRGTGPIPGW